jgi:hypothetical protein
MSGTFGNLKKRIVRKKLDIVMVVVWTALIALIVIKAYWVAYHTEPHLVYEKPLYPVYGGPMPELLDLLIITVAGVIVGIFLTDAKEMLYGYVASMSLAFITAVIYVTLYVWYVLEWGPTLSAASNWEWAVFFSIEIVFAMMFPWILSISLISLALGAFLKEWIT